MVALATAALPAHPDSDTLRTELPQKMQEARRWVVWCSIPRSGRKPRKVPYYVDGSPRQTTNTPEDAARLASLDAALEALQKGRYTGIGFALGADGAGGRWQGVDLDGTTTRPELAALVDMLPGYVETSPSGTGVHAMGYGPAFASLGSNASGIEAYAAGRYFAVTGEAIGGELEDLAPFVADTLAPKHRHSDAAGEQGQSDPVHVEPRTVVELRQALVYLDADDRGTWVRVGMALAELGHVGRGLWLEWSQLSDKYDPQDASRVGPA